MTRGGAVLGVLVGAALAAAPWGACAMEIHTSAPGNLFTAGAPVVAKVRAARSGLTFQLVDYSGRQVRSGAVSGSGDEAEIGLGALEPGYYELRCHDGQGESTTAAIGVVRDRKGAPLPAAGRVCADAASAWLLHSEGQRRPFARMVRLAGIPWVRERLSWSEAEPERGRLRWGRYQTTAETLAAEGVRIYQIFHDSPGWSRPGKPGTLCPDDLRDVYRFLHRAAAHFRSQIHAWEVWNEPDIFFWPDLSDRFAGVQKAAYLGLKDGNPAADVLLGSLCIGVSPFARHLYETGIGAYFDVFNWHIYDVPAAYPRVLGEHLRLLSQHRLSGRPVWLTEAGIRLTGTEGDGKRLLSSSDQRLQCQFVPRAVALSLAGGTDRHFFFVLPDYLENGVQFGSLRPDLTPYPSFIALSAAANLLGQSSYLGAVRGVPGKLTAHAFRTPRGIAVVAWADEQTELSLPAGARGARLADTFGRETDLPARDGRLVVKVGPEAVYVLGVGPAILKEVTGAPRPRGRRRPGRPPRVVLVGHADLPIEKGHDCYLVGHRPGDDPSRPIPYTVDVYNFQERQTAAGTVSVSVPRGWTARPSRQGVRVEPMGRATLAFEVVPGQAGLAPARLKVQGRFGPERPAPSVSYFETNPASLIPERRQALEWSDAAHWRPSASGNGSVAVSRTDAGALRFEARFHASGDRWAYPFLALEPPADFTGYDGIAFRLRTDAEDAHSYVRLMLAEPNGAHYMAGTRTTGDSRRMVFLFRDMEWLPIMGPDDNGRLDLDRIAVVRLGCNTPRDALWFEVSGFELVRFASGR